MEDFFKKNVFLDGLIFIVLFAGILAVFLSGSFLLSTKYTDFSCVRSSGQTECTLVRTFQFSKSAEIKIHNPVAVDISECEDIFGRDYSSPACKTPSSANIRSKDGSSKINIYYGQDRQAVRAVAREINEFLLSSNAPSFHKRF